MEETAHKKRGGGLEKGLPGTRSLTTTKGEARSIPTISANVFFNQKVKTDSPIKMENGRTRPSLASGFVRRLRGC